MSREAAYQGLFNLLSTLQTAGTVKIVDRRVQLLETMQPAQLPALFMAVGGQKVATKEKMPAARTFDATVFLYVANPDPKTSADIALNNLLDALEAVLAPLPAQEKQTLGGVVSHCWIEGAIEVFSGPLGQRAAAIVPVKMLVP